MTRTSRRGSSVRIGTEEVPLDTEELYYNQLHWGLPEPMFGTEQPMSVTLTPTMPSSSWGSIRDRTVHVPAHDLMRGPNNQVRSVRLAHRAQVVPYIHTHPHAARHIN